MPDSSPTAPQLRNCCAEMLGLDDLALKYYDERLRLARDGQHRYNARSDKAFCAWKAAVAAGKAGQWPRAAELLDIMRDFGDTWVKEAGQQKGELVRKLLAAPNDIDLRIEVAQKLFVDNVPALGRYHEPARQLLVDTLKLSRSDQQKLSMYRSIQEYSQQLGDAETAQAYIERIAKEFPNDPAGDEAAFSLAQFHFGQKQFDKARDLLKRIVESGRQNRYVSMAHLGLAETYAELKDEAAMVKHLKHAAEAPATPTNRGIMDTSDTQQTALVRLGKYYQSNSDHAAALKCFEQWQPRSFCGTCWAQMKYERDLYIAQCLVALGRSDEAIEKHLLPYVTSDGLFRPDDPQIPRLIVEIHENRGALDQLLTQMQPLVEKKSPGQARAIHHLVQIRLWRKQGDIAALMGQLRHGDRPIPSLRDPLARENWRQMAAAEALAELGGKEFPALEKRYEELLQRINPNDYHAESGDRLWLIYAMGLSQAPEARPYLQQLLEKAQAPEGHLRAGRTADDFRAALSLREKKDRPGKGKGGSPKD